MIEINLREKSRKIEIKNGDVLLLDNGIYAIAFDNHDKIGEEYSLGNLSFMKLGEYTSLLHGYFEIYIKTNKFKIIGNLQYMELKFKD